MKTSKSTTTKLSYAKKFASKVGETTPVTEKNKRDNDSTPKMNHTEYNCEDGKTSPRPSITKVLRIINAQKQEDFEGLSTKNKMDVMRSPTGSHHQPKNSLKTPKRVEPKIIEETSPSIKEVSPEPRFRKDLNAYNVNFKTMNSMKQLIGMTSSRDASTGANLTEKDDDPKLTKYLSNHNLRSGRASIGINESRSEHLLRVATNAVLASEPPLFEKDADETHYTNHQTDSDKNLDIVEICKKKSSHARESSLSFQNLFENENQSKSIKVLENSKLYQAINSKLTKPKATEKPRSIISPAPQQRKEKENAVFFKQPNNNERVSHSKEPELRKNKSPTRLSEPFHKPRKSLVFDSVSDKQQVITSSRSTTSDHNSVSVMGKIKTNSQSTSMKDLEDIKEERELLNNFVENQINEDIEHEISQEMKRGADEKETTHRTNSARSKPRQGEPLTVSNKNTGASKTPKTLSKNGFFSGPNETRPTNTNNMDTKNDLRKFKSSTPVNSTPQLIDSIQPSARSKFVFKTTIFKPIDHNTIEEYVTSVKNQAKKALAPDNAALINKRFNNKSTFCSPKTPTPILSVRETSLPRREDFNSTRRLVSTESSPLSKNEALSTRLSGKFREIKRAKHHSPSPHAKSISLMDVSEKEKQNTSMNAFSNLDKILGAWKKFDKPKEKDPLMIDIAEANEEKCLFGGGIPSHSGGTPSTNYSFQKGTQTQKSNNAFFFSNI
jgi:hypothetical protein